MEAPNNVYVRPTNLGAEICTSRHKEGTKYIRSDLVDKLIGYAVHRGICPQVYKEGPCTCGLSDLIKEVQG